MSNGSWLRSGLVASLAFALGACASAPNPWLAHDRGADMKAALADPGRMCDVVLSNGTDHTVEAYLAVPGSERSLGLLNAGQSLELGVACSSRRVLAEAVSQDLDASEGQRFRKGALLDVTSRTHVRITPADEVRW